MVRNGFIVGLLHVVIGSGPQINLGVFWTMNTRLQYYCNQPLSAKWFCYESCLGINLMKISTNAEDLLFTEPHDMMWKQEWRTSKSPVSLKNSDCYEAFLAFQKFTAMKPHNKATVEVDICFASFCV